MVVKSMLRFWRQTSYVQNLALSFICSKLQICNGNPLQYSCLENPMDKGAWWVAVHGVARSLTRLSDFTFIFMHWRRKWQPTCVLAWRIPGTGEPGGLPSMGSQSWTQLKLLSSKLPQRAFPLSCISIYP